MAFVLVVNELHFPVSTSRWLCQCPGRRHMVYSLRDWEEFKNQVSLKAWAWIRTISKEWRSMPGWRKAEQQGWQGVVRRLWGGGSGSRRGCWQGAYDRGGCPRPSTVRERGRDPPLPPPASTCHGLNPDGSQRARAPMWVRRAGRERGGGWGRQIESI